MAAITVPNTAPRTGPKDISEVSVELVVAWYIKEFREYHKRLPTRQEIVSGLEDAQLPLKHLPAILDYLFALGIVSEETRDSKSGNAHPAPRYRVNGEAQGYIGAVAEKYAHLRAWEF